MRRALALERSILAILSRATRLLAAAHIRDEPFRIKEGHGTHN